MGDNKEIIVTDGFPESHGEFDRTTGRYEGTDGQPGKFVVKDGRRYYTGALNDLEITNAAENKTQEVAGAQEVAEQTGDDVELSYDTIYPELQQRVTEEEFDTFADNLETLEDRSLYTQEESNQFHAGWEYWTQEVKFAVVEVLGQREEGEPITETYEKIDALLSPRGKSNFTNGFERLPAIIRDAMDGE